MFYIFLCLSQPAGNVGNGMLLFPFLLMDYYVVLIGHPGAGNGRHQKFTMAEALRRTEMYIEKLQPNPGNPVFLWGISAGANLAVWLASQLGKEKIKAVCAVVPPAPGNPAAYVKAKGLCCHPLGIKTKTDSRCNPFSSVANFLLKALQKQAAIEVLTSMDSTWHDNLKLDDVSPVSLEAASMQAYFHNPKLLEREWYGGTGPGTKDDYKDQMTAVADQVKRWIDEATKSRHMQGLLYCPEIFTEYANAFITHDVSGLSVLSKVASPCLICACKGGPASGTHNETWKESLPKETYSEVVFCQMIKPGFGGIDAHGHSSIFWRRHVLTVHRFFNKIGGRSDGTREGNVGNE